MDIEAKNQRALELVDRVAHGVSWLYRIWRNELGNVTRDRLLPQLEKLRAAVVEVQEAAGTDVTDFSTVTTFDRAALDTLVTRMGDWSDGADVPEAVRELAGDCVEGLSRQRPSEIDRLQRGNQETIPLTETLSRAITCLGSLRNVGADLFDRKEVLEALLDLVTVIPQMPEGTRAQFGVTVNDQTKRVVEKLRGIIQAQPAGSDVATAEVRDLATAALTGLLGGELPE